MPLFVYKCPRCGATKEELQRSSETALAPDCDADNCLGPVLKVKHKMFRPKMERQLSAPAVHLKGTGWARDGYIS